MIEERGSSQSTVVYGLEALLSSFSVSNADLWLVIGCGIRNRGVVVLELESITSIKIYKNLRGPNLSSGTWNFSLSSEPNSERQIWKPNSITDGK